MSDSKDILFFPAAKWPSEWHAGELARGADESYANRKAVSGMRIYGPIERYEFDGSIDREITIEEYCRWLALGEVASPYNTFIYDYEDKDISDLAMVSNFGAEGVANGDYADFLKDAVIFGNYPKSSHIYHLLKDNFYFQQDRLADGILSHEKYAKIVERPAISFGIMDADVGDSGKDFFQALHELLEMGHRDFALKHKQPKLFPVYRLTFSKEDAKFLREDLMKISYEDRWNIAQRADNSSSSRDDGLGILELLYNFSLEGKENAIISPWIEMSYEYRVFVVNQKIASGAGRILDATPLDRQPIEEVLLASGNSYPIGTESLVMDLFDSRMVENADDLLASAHNTYHELFHFSEEKVREIAKEIPELKNYVLDVAMGPDSKVVVVELNSLSGSGFYANGAREILKALREK